MNFADGLPAIEAKARRHVPACYEFVEFEARETRPFEPNPAPYSVTVTIRKIAETEEPPDWRLDLAKEIRFGWDGWEFAFVIHELPTEF